MKLKTIAFLFFITSCRYETNCSDPDDEIIADGDKIYQCTSLGPFTATEKRYRPYYLCNQEGYKTVIDDPKDPLENGYRCVNQYDDIYYSKDTSGFSGGIYCPKIRDNYWIKLTYEKSEKFKRKNDYIIVYYCGTEESYKYDSVYHEKSEYAFDNGQYAWCEKGVEPTLSEDRSSYTCD